MSQPQKLRNFPPLKPRLLPTVRQEDKWRPVELWILLVKSFCWFYLFASALKKMGKKDKGGSHMGCMHSALWAQCKFLWFSTLALWKELPHRQYKILKRFLGTTSKKVFTRTLLSIPGWTAFLVWRHSNFIYTCCFRPGLVQGFSSDGG